MFIFNECFMKISITLKSYPPLAPLVHLGFSFTGSLAWKIKGLKEKE